MFGSAKWRWPAWPPITRVDLSQLQCQSWSKRMVDRSSILECSLSNYRQGEIWRNLIAVKRLSSFWSYHGCSGAKACVPGSMRSPTSCRGAGEPTAAGSAMHAWSSANAPRPSVKLTWVRMLALRGHAHCNDTAGSEQPDQQPALKTFCKLQCRPAYKSVNAWNESWAEREENLHGMKSLRFGKLYS